MISVRFEAPTSLIHLKTHAALDIEGEELQHTANKRSLISLRDIASIKYLRAYFLL